MADFRIWGTISHIGPHRFLVLVSAIPDPWRVARTRPLVESRTVSSRALALEASAGLVLRMGLLVRDRGDRVVDVEDAG